ncbi:hypothetical protein F2Q69_00024483 [Brassica cretica]|uniref:Uncharacterized protein n=1 Tax=Brassica cretica TaxID=69181 RepID=A0A8S9QUK8_BRACR|nr:hypothetical protein F2Q69_00024483 [Brassica cretica]
MHIFIFIRRFGVTPRIQIDAFDFFILFTFLDRRKVFRLFPRWRGSSFIGILSRRFPLRVGRPVDRNREIESFSADSGCFTRKNGPEHLLDFLERCGVCIGVDRGYVPCWSLLNVVGGGSAVKSFLVIEIVGWHV